MPDGRDVIPDNGIRIQPEGAVSVRKDQREGELHQSHVGPMFCDVRAVRREEPLPGNVVHRQQVLRRDAEGVILQQQVDVVCSVVIEQGLQSRLQVWIHCAGGTVDCYAVHAGASCRLSTSGQSRRAKRLTGVKFFQYFRPA